MECINGSSESNTVTWQTFSHVPQLTQARNSPCKPQFISIFDLLNTKNQVPEESIFGHFDLIFCRNVLIYFNKDYQDRILNKLHNTMHASTYLILGESEEPTLEQTKMFFKTNNLFKIYQKQD